MKKKHMFKKATSLALASAMALSMAACGSSGEEQQASGEVASTQEQSAAAESNAASEEAPAASEEAPAVEIEETTLKIRVMNEFRNLDKVLAKYEEMTKDDPILSKIDLEFEYVAGGDYKDKITMALAAQEDYDLMFCGGWHGLPNFIQEGNFADLSSYFNNDAFPGLKKAFSPDLVEAMNTYVRQEDGTYISGIYGINLPQGLEDSRGFMYREDLRKKYNCAEITDEESFMAFVKTVAENEADMIGLSLSNFFRLDSPWYSAKHDNVYTQDNVNIFGDQTWVYVGLSADGKTVLNAVVAGDAPEQFAKMPAGYQEDFITKYHVDRTKWNPYLFEGRGTTDTVQPNAAAAYCTLSEYEAKVKTDLEANPDWEFGFYVIEDAQRNKEAGAVVCDMVTNNWLVVPEWSENIDATMYFLDYMFGVQEAHDLFQYGIEGEDWTAIGDDGYANTDISDEEKYVMPGYSFCWNPTYTRYSQFVMDNADIKAQWDYVYDPATYKLSPLSGFVFDSTNVASELAGVTALSNELQLTLSMYDAGEVESKIADWHAEAEKVGLEAVRAELVAQIQVFLDAKNAK